MRLFIRGARRRPAGKHRHAFVGSQRLRRSHLFGKHRFVCIGRVTTRRLAPTQALPQHLGIDLEIEDDESDAPLGSEPPRLDALVSAQKGGIEDRVDLP